MASNTCAGGQSFGTIEIQMQSSLVLREFLRRKAHPPDSRYSVLLGRAPCEAWRPMVTPTDQARSREGRVAGIGRGPLALPLPSPPLSPRALARLVRSHAPCAHTPPSKKKEGLRSDSSGRLGPPRCGPRFFLCQGRGSFTLKDDEGR